jgi:hypothetical protein
MTEEEFDDAAENGDFYDEYAEYVMTHCHGDRIICNGDTLISAMEDGYLYEDFKDSKVKVFTEKTV